MINHHIVFKYYSLCPSLATAEHDIFKQLPSKGGLVGIELCL